MKTHPQNFIVLMQVYAGKHDLRTVFNDFISLAIAAASKDVVSGQANDEDTCAEILKRYKSDPLSERFSMLFEQLAEDFADRQELLCNPDILGEFYESFLPRWDGKQRFFSWYLCRTVAGALIRNFPSPDTPFIDHACGSGRMMLALASIRGNTAPNYGTSHHITCVKMTAINLLLGRAFGAEVMWADPEHPADFKLSYRISESPYGAFLIKDKEQSKVWLSKQRSSGRSQT